MSLIAVTRFSGIPAQGSLSGARNSGVASMGRTGLRMWALAGTVAAALAGAREPIRLHPGNPHYFLFREKPTVLITSTEAYGAILNPDFDYVTYLDTLQAAGLNLARVANGNFLESVSTTIWRGGDQNPIAPRFGRYLAPWARSDRPGYFFGGNKFDLDRWDENYFRRLRDFVRAAGERGIVVEINAFYTLFGEGPNDGSWVLHPFHEKNNVNGVGRIPWHRYATLDDRAIVARQEALLRKTLAELNEFDNVYYEICDEPYWAGASPAETDAWQRHLIEVFVDAERALPWKHLIAVNFANGYLPIEAPHEAISVFNFHYASPPAAVPLNWRFNRPIMFDETAPKGGTVALDRRREAWAFMLCGGAGYNNLDSSFATDDPTGSGRVEQDDGRFDGREVRSQLGILKKFMESLDFVRMRPNPRLLYLGPNKPSELWYALEEPGRAYAVYFRGRATPARATFALDLPAGRWQGSWLNPRDGQESRIDPFEHPGGAWRGGTPEFVEDIALRLTRAPNP